MKIGYACTPVSLDKRTSRTFVLKNFSKDKLFECLSLNLQDLKSILEFNIKHQINMFRISSDIVPFGSHEVNDIKWWNLFQKELLDIGNFIKDKGIRVSMHPGQYTVLNSPSDEVVKKSIRDLEYHCRFLDALEVNLTNKIVLHIGGVYGDKLSALRRFEKNFKLLSNSSRRRLILENDDRCFTIEEVLDLCSSLNIPAVFDNLHHKCNPSLGNDLNYILKRVKESWSEEDGTMKLHYSDSDNTKKLGAHSKFVLMENFFNYYSMVKTFDADIMLEVKDKEISALKCVNALNPYPKKSTIYDQWAKYKYTVMEKNYSYYKECSKIVNSSGDIVEFYKYLDFVLQSNFNEENFKNTLFHTWGYIKDLATAKEKTQFTDLMEKDKDFIKTKNFIKRLSKKYSVDYLLNSYYFIY